VSDPTEKLDVGGVASFNGIKVGGNGTDIDSTFLGANSIMTFKNNGTEHMRIDNSGRVGIGTTNPTSKMVVDVGNNLPAASGNMDTGVVLQSNSGSHALNMGASATEGYSWINAAYANNSSIASSLVLMTGAQERMRIAPAGNVCISGDDAYGAGLRVAGSPSDAANYSLITSSPAVGLAAGSTQNMAYFANGRSGISANDGLKITSRRDTTAPGIGNWETESFLIERNVDNVAPQASLAFGNKSLTAATNGVDRLTIDSLGNVLIGTARPLGGTENLAVGTNIYSNGTFINSKSAVDANVYLCKTGQINGEYLQFARDGSDIGNISYNGSSMLMNTTSDERLKKNIAPAGSALDVIKGIEVVSHDWTDDSKTHVEWGVLAQQVNGFLPSAVTEGSEDVNDNPWMVSRDSFVIPMLKAMQEQQAMIEALKAEVEALKNA
jgi:hypothetical protein